MKKTEWSPEHQKRAVEEGWMLVAIVDDGRPTSRWYYMVWNVPEHPAMKTRHNAERLIVDQAKKGSKFHQHAMSIVAASRVPR